jgi:predicted TIM-barrel fold metal-dependent hydrolase
MKKYRIIDSHCHIYPDKIAQKASDATATFYELPPSLDGKISTLIEHGEKAGIEHFIVQSVATTPKQVSSINNFIAQAVAESRGRFTGLGTLHPDSEDMEADVNEILSLGLKGVKLHPDIQNFKVDDPKVIHIFEICNEKCLPLLIHTGDSRFDNSNPDRVEKILKMFPDLTIIGAHFGGWSVWEEATEKLSKYKNFYVDTCSSFYALSRETARKIIDSYGYEKVIFGTDFPMWKQKDELEFLFSLGLSDKQLEDILFNNFMNIINS